MIERLDRKHEAEYIKWLDAAREHKCKALEQKGQGDKAPKGIFKQVHGIIAKQLLRLSKPDRTGKRILDIEAVEVNGQKKKVRDPNVFRNNTPAQLWRKI